MSNITAINGRILYNSRGSKTIEVDVTSDEKFLGRVCAPSGASVGKYEATSFPNNNPEESLSLLKNNSEKFIGSCLLYTSPSPRDYAASRMPSSA